MSGNIRGIVQHFMFKPWINESMVFIERGSDLARAINREMVPQGLGTCCFRGSQAQTTAWNVLTEMESKGSQGEEGGKDLRERTACTKWRLICRKINEGKNREI